MKIAIIGAGSIGGNLTRRLTGLGHTVSVANSRGPETLKELTDETGAVAVPVEAVAAGAELVIVAIPVRSVPDLPTGVLDAALPDAVVIDTGNYYPQQRDGKIAEIEDGMTESSWVAAQLGRPVVKVFNNVYADHLLHMGTPAGTPGRVALPVAGDDQQAKDVVLKLLDDLGFDGVDAGGLDESWRQQPGTPAYGTDFDVIRLTQALRDASPDRPAGHKA